jgi:phosphoglycerate dehydrogenase-like enzyme
MRAGKLVIGVSQTTLEQSRYWMPIEDVELVALSPTKIDSGLADTVLGIWRRQHDRTTWLVSLLAALPKLRWIHNDTVGVDRLPLKDLLRRDILLTNSRGAFVNSMVEWALCVMLMSTKCMPQFLAEAEAGNWASHVIPSDFRGLNVLIIGYGSVGRELAAKCSNLGLNVNCVRRKKSPDKIDESVNIISVEDDWRNLVSQCDFLVVAVPLTAETENLVDADVIRRLKPTARLINIARAQVVDENAMILALRAGVFAEAWLDVFTVEPLPRDHQLWGESKVFITPHKSSVGESSELSTRLLFQREIQQMLKGRPPINQVDLEQGY